MLYEQYRSKIEKVADVLGTMRRYRILIICVCAFIAALTVTLLSVSGTVFDTAECPSEITAGEELAYRAGAVFNYAGYEFCVNGSDAWTADMPTRPGEYLVRSVSRDIAGNPRYGKTHIFTVLPRTVTVTADCASAVYGELPPVKADLLYADKITCSAFTYSDYSSATTTVEPVAESVKVYDEKGNDVTYTYNIRTQSSQMNFIRREITVSLSPYTADYDGKEHPKIPYTGYEISGETPLAEGDFEEVYVSVFRTEAGEYANDIYFKIHKKTEDGSVEVTSNYDIKVTSGTLTVNKRTLEITTADFTAVYDGLEKYEEGFTLAESSLSALNAAGHSITVIGNTVEKNAGEYENVLEFIITDENGNDVTSNYNLDIAYGSFNILPRPLTCSTASAEWYYDGTTHSDNTGFVILKNSFSSYASEDEVAYFIEGSKMHVKDVADSCKNMLEIGVLNTATGEDVTGNYAVNYIYGDLTVIPRPVKVAVDGEEWEYDGKAHSSNKHTIFYDETLFDSALIEGHTVTARGLKTITEVGSVQNSIDFGIFDGDEIVTDNYDIKWNNGDITVIPRKITVGAMSYEKIYDGAPLNSYGVEVVSENGLVEGHTISGETEGTVTNAETVYSSITDINTVTIFDENGEDISYNYEIENIAVGTLTVHRREITITAGTAQKVYDGTPLTCAEYGVLSELEIPLVKGHKTIVTTEGSVTDATSGINSISDYSVMSGETDVTANYKVECATGTLTVTKRRAILLTASTDEQNKIIYNGSPQSLEKFEEIEEDNINTGILYGHTALIDTVFCATDADTYDNILSFIIVSSEGEVTDNYDLSVGYGKLTISPRPITVTSSSKTDFIYDGTAKYYLECTIDDLVEGHTWQADEQKPYTQVTDAGIEDNKFEVGIFDGEKEVTKNYEISYNRACGKILVNPRTITVTTDNNLKLIYNGVEQSHLECTAGNLVQGHSAVADQSKVYTKLTDVGEAENKFEVNIFNGEIKVTGNYIINYSYGTIKINPRTITLKTATREWVFDGEYHSDGAVEEVEDGALLDEYGHTLAYGGTLPEIKEAGEKENEFELRILNAEGQDISYNYEITPQYGTLTVNPLPIKVIANSDNKDYDATPLTNDGFTVTANGCVAEFNRLAYTFKATVEGSITEVGEEDNIVSNLKVYDETEVNSDNFVITYVNGKLTITPRPVTVTSDGAQKTYDGKPLSCDKWKLTSGALISGQELTVTITTSKTDAGVYDNEIDSYEIKDGNTDVTRNYKVTQVNGKLIIDKRPVTITADDAQKIYDGEALTCSTWKFTEGELVDGQELTVTITSSAINAGKHDNIISKYTVTDEEVGDVTRNYQVTTVKGTLQIDKRKITVTTVDKKDFIYDGTAQSCLECTADNLVQGHSVVADTAKTYTMITDVGNAENKFAVNIFNGETKVIGNYEVTDWDYGTLSVNPRPIDVYAADSEKVYDGTTAIPAASKNYGSGYKGDETLFGIVEGHKIYADITYAEEAGAKIGTYAIKICGDIIIKDGNRVVTSNYEITAVEQPYATLTVTPRPITVATYDREDIYNGEPLTNDGYFINNLVSGHNGEITVTGTITDAGSTGNTFDADSLKITFGEENVTGNYEIVDGSIGTLTVTPRPISVVTDSDTKPFDGTPLTNGGYTAGNLVEGHTAVITVTGSQTEIGSSDNTVDAVGFTVTDADDNEVKKSNYYIDTEKLYYGQLKVTGELTIRTASDEKVYDGAPLTNSEWEIVEGFVPEGFTLEVIVSGSQTLAGETDNVFTCQIFKGEEDASNYFEIKYERGTLKVTPRPITVTSGSASKMYDGTPLKYDKWEITDGTLAEGQFAQVYVHGEITHVGTALNLFETDIHDENGLSVIRSYSVTADFGTLTVTENTETNDDKVRIRAKSDIGGSVYLRQQSFGDYLSGMSWTNAAQYGSALSYNGAQYGYNYLTSFALGGSGDFGTVDIELTALSGTYLLPYYARTDDHVIQTSDTIYTGDKTQYSVNYTVYDYLASGKPYTSVYAREEAQYSRFVKENYLTVDDQTRSFLEGIIRENNLTKDDIAGVAEYIKGTATYDLEQDYTQLESSENVIISFLRDSQYGVCRHFATAGTMLYRALGIPARYTVGFARNLKAGEWAEFTAGHAWVELYIDGLGWVMVEVTPSASMNGGEGEGDGDTENHAYTVTLKPKDAVKTYDGTPVTATEVFPDITLLRLEELDYTYKIVFEGSQTEVGESESSVAGFTLYSPDGSVFTDVGVIYKKGRLKVVEEPIVTIQTYGKTFEYDGIPHYFGSGDYIALFPSGMSGYRAEVTGLEKVGFAKIGVLTPEQMKAAVTVTVYNGRGEDVTANFYVEYDTDFVITPIAVTIATHNVSKEYDGAELVDESDPQITFGSLMAGHSIQVTHRPSIIEPDEIDNSIAFIIVDENGTDVSEYYDITKEYGKLIITDGD